MRDAKPYFEDIPAVKLPDEMVELAEHILETKAGHFDASEFEDRYETAVVEMLKQKQATVVNLMDARRRSVQAERPATRKGKTAEKVGKPSGKRKAG